jgi:hypothetical protein
LRFDPMLALVRFNALTGSFITRRQYAYNCGNRLKNLRNARFDYMQIAVIRDLRASELAEKVVLSRSQIPGDHPKSQGIEGPKAVIFAFATARDCGNGLCKTKKQKSGAGSRGLWKN